MTLVPQPPELPDNLPPPVVAYIRALEVKIAELEARLNQNSTNSSKPPSSDPPARQAGPAQKPPSGKKRGGQPGHPKAERTRLPPTRSTPPKPSACGTAHNR